MFLTFFNVKYDSAYLTTEIWDWFDILSVLEKKSINAGRRLLKHFFIKMCFSVSKMMTFWFHFYVLIVVHFAKSFFWPSIWHTQWFGKIWKKNSGKDFYVPRTGPLNCYPKMELLQYMLTFLCLILQHSDLHCTILYVFWSVRHVIVTVMVPFWKYFRIIELWKRGRRDVISCLDIEKGNLKVTILQQQRAVYWNSVVT